MSDDSGSELESSDEDGEGDQEEKKKEEEKVVPLQKSKDEIKKSLFLGEKYGHYKIGTYVRMEVRLNKDISRKLEPDFPIVLCSLKQ